MIRFITGIFTIIAGVGYAEGTGPLGAAILLSTLGSMIMVWGVYGMAQKGQLDV